MRDIVDETPLETLPSPAEELAEAKTADASQNRELTTEHDCPECGEHFSSCICEEAQGKPELPTVEQIIHDAENRVIDLRGCSRLNARTYLGMNPPSIHWRNHAEALAEALRNLLTGTATADQYEKAEAALASWEASKQ